MTHVLPEPVPHGGDLDTARARYPAAPEPWLDLSTGINPFSYPLPALLGDAWTRLPQISAEAELRSAAAAAYGARSADAIASAPGSQALIQIVPRLLNPSPVVVIAPTYAEHAIAWRREGHDVAEIANIADIGHARVVVVTNPNNPTGTITPTPDLRALAATLHARDGLLVIDEAFADVAPEGTSMIPELPAATVVLRSLGKAYGLGGLRLGFAVAAPPIAARLRDLLGPWAVSGPALAIGIAALHDTEWRVATTRKLDAACARLDALLTAGGFTLLGGTPLFRLAAHPAASAFVDRLGHHGIHVRAFAAQPTWLRFGLPGEQRAWQRLEAALADSTAQLQTKRGIA